MLPNKPRGIPRVDDRRILNGISGSCDQVHHGAIYQAATVPIRLATIVSFAGGGLASGTGSWMRWLLLMMRRCK
jgi:hypothetical protein